MGVTQLWQVLAPVERHQTLASLQGLTLAVDLSIWVCETQCVKQMQGVVSKPFLRNLFFRISHLTQLGVKLVFVIEGTAPELKWEVMMQRQQTRYPGRQGKQLSQRPVSKQTRRNFNSCLKECCDLLDILGIPYVQSRGEAEAMCALLNAAGLVDGCLTNDGDAFLYGARTVYRNFTMNTKDPHVEMYSMSDVENQLEIDRNGLVALGLLLGCDFVPKGVPGIGMANATKLLQSLKGMDVLKRLQEWRKMSESQCVNQAEVLARRKGIGTPDFPQVKVIQEFMTAKDRCPSSISPWKRPVLAKFQEFALVKLEWPVEYTLEKVLPLITLWDMQDVLGSSNPSTHQHLKPHRIVKTRVRQGIPCYEVEWYKPVTDTSYDGDFFVTVETQELFAKCNPHVVRLLEMETTETNKKKKKSQAKKKKKNSEKAGDNINEALNNLSFNFEKMNLAAVTEKIQKSVKSLPQSHPAYESQQSLLMTKIKQQKHYSAGHAIAPGSTSYTDDHCTPPAVTVPISDAVESGLNNSVGVNSPVFLKSVRDLNVAGSNHNDSDEENLLPFLERVKLRMKSKQSEPSNKQEINLAAEKSSAENSGGKSGKKKNKKKKGAKQDNQDNSKQNSDTKAATPRVDTRSIKSSKAKHLDKSAADLSDMNSLLEDIESLSLLRENALNQRNGDANMCNSASSTRGVCKAGSVSEPDKLKQRLSFSSTSQQKSVASPVTPFGMTRSSVTSNFRKMSSPHCEDVCSPMSYIQNSGKLSESFEIRDSPGNTEGSSRSKKKAKKARKASKLAAASCNGTPAGKSASSSVKKPTIVEKQKLRTPGDHKSGLKNMPQVTSSPANLTEIDTTAVKDFGDFKIQHSLLNNLCASLVQAITPKGISREEYDKLCAALNKLDDKEENSSAANEWIESEIDKSLKQVGLSTAEAVSKNIHSSFIKAANSPVDYLRNVSMQSVNKLNGMAGINVESEEFKNLSKSARKKLRRKERLKMLNNESNSSMNVDNVSGVGNLGSFDLNVKPQKSQPKENATQLERCGKGCTAVKVPVNVQKNKVHVNGTGDCNMTSICHDTAKRKLASASGNSLDYLIGTNPIASLNKVSAGFVSRKENQVLSVNKENLAGVDIPVTANTAEAPKKRKKKKKKKVKKAQAITNLSADESMVGDLQKTLCSEYLRKAIENLRASSKENTSKIEKASPVMDLSADETVLELDDLSSHLSGVGSNLDSKTRLKLARKRSSLEKMKQTKEESQKQLEDCDKSATKQDIRCSNQELVIFEPVLSLNKVIDNETKRGSENVPLESTDTDIIKVKPNGEVGINRNKEEEQSDERVFTADMADDVLKINGAKDETVNEGKLNELNDEVCITISENDAQSTVSENDIQFTVSENDIQFTVSENEAQSTISENEMQSAVSGNEAQSTDKLRETFGINGERASSVERLEEDKFDSLMINRNREREIEIWKYVEDIKTDISAAVNVVDEDKSSVLPGLCDKIGAKTPEDKPPGQEILSFGSNFTDAGSQLNDRQDLEQSESNVSGVNTNLTAGSLEDCADKDNGIILVSDDDDEEEIMVNGHIGNHFSAEGIVNGGCENVDDIYIHIQLENGGNETNLSPLSSDNADSDPTRDTEKAEDGSDSDIENNKSNGDLCNSLMFGINGAENGGYDMDNGHTEKITESITRGKQCKIDFLQFTKEEEFYNGHTSGSKSKDQSFISNVCNGFDHSKEKCYD